MRLAALFAPVSLLCALVLSGCASSFDPSPVPGQSDVGLIKGNVYGGRQPIVGAQIYMFAVGSGGYGGPGIAASTANKSTSLLGNFNLNGFPTTQNTTGTALTNPLFDDYYVTTDSNGNFQLAGDYTCTSGTQVYLYSLGGQPSPGVTNTSAGLMALLGNCPAGGSLSTQVPAVYMNEVSTVAAAYALAGFASDAVHIANSGTTAGNLGVKNAAANAAQIYDISGAHGGIALTTTAGGNGTVPQTKINSLANSLAACVNSTGSGTAQCTTNLFNAVMSGGASGTTATDTATEAIYIAQNPATAVSTVWSNAASIGYPYTPYLSAAAPNDWTIGVTFTGSFSAPYLLAVDASGNVWVPNGGGSTVSVLTPLGTQLSGFPASTGGTSPAAVAIDTSGNAWVTNFSSQNVSVLSSSGTLLYGTPDATTAIGGSPIGIAADMSDVYVPTNTGNTVTAFTESATVATGSGFGSSESVNAGLMVAVDSAEHIWVGSQGPGLYISEFDTHANSYAGLRKTAAISEPNFIAIDHSNNVWISLKSATELEVINSSGSPLSFSPVSGGGLDDPIGLSIDGAGNVFAANDSNNSISEISNTGTVISPSTGFNGLNSPYALAVDGSGNVWVSNHGGNTVTEFIGLAVPVLTPLSAGVVNNQLGSRP